jgi:DNA polymerase I-like protein with 3'-5' exonuclease and polymerase domains
MITLDAEFLELDEELNFDDDIEREMVVYQPSFEDYFEEESAGLEPSIVLIDDEEKWNNALEQFKNTKCFAFDLETYGVNDIDPLFFRNNRIRLIQVGLSTDLCMVADLGGWLDEESFADKVSKYDSFLRVLQEKLEDPEVIVLGVNLKFDFTTIRQHFGFVGVQARDLMIISQVLLAGVGVEKAKAGENRSERCKISHGLKAIAERCGITLDKSQQTSNWGWRLSNKQLNYAAKDVTVLFELFEVLKPQVLNQGLTYTAFVECNAVSVFAEAEFMGVPVNLEKAKKALDLYEEKIQACVNEFEKYFPGLNWQSNPQVLEAFQEGLEGFSELFVDGKKPSVGKEILNQLEHPAAKALAKARKLNTAKNNVKAFVDNSFDGRIRGFYQQNVPGGTGRSSCSAKLSLNRKKYMFGAQLQNPPSGGDESLPSVRSLVEAPEGYAFGIFDGAQMHMRVAAQLSEDKTLLRIYNEDFDGHCLMAAKIAELQGLNWTAEFISGIINPDIKDKNWEKDAAKAYSQYEKSSTYPLEIESNLSFEDWFLSIKGHAKKLRKLGKTPLYSNLNGATAKKITQSLVQGGFDWFTQEDGKELFEYFKQLYAGLVKYVRDSFTKANSINTDFSYLKDYNGKPVEGIWGKVVTLTGRHIYFKKYPNDYRKGQLQVSYTDSTAANWLPAEANLIKHWAVEVFKEIRKHPEWGAWIGNLIHDELSIIFKEEYALEVATMVREKQREVFGSWITVIPPMEEEENVLKFVHKSWDEK